MCVDLGEVILVHMRVGVLLAVVAVTVFVFNVLMAVTCVRVAVGFTAVLVFVDMRFGMSVLLGHGGFLS